jgi:hypothetical protein
MKDIIVDATRNVRDGGENNQSTDTYRTLPGSKYKLHNNSFLYVTSSGNQRNAKVRVDIEISSQVLSNCPYDIKVVLATPLAGDTTIVEDKERRYVIELNYPEVPTRNTKLKNISLLPEGQEYIAVQPGVVDTVTLVEDFVFPVSTYNDPINRMHMTFKSFEQRTTEYSKSMAINCIILEPKYTPDFVRKEITTEEEVE